MRIPAAEVTIDEGLVRALLREQCPGFGDLKLTRAGVGWDNETWRLGDVLAVRLPRREAALGFARNEHLWLGRLGPGLPVAVPAPVHVGAPGVGYPWPWAIIPWADGVTADDEPLAPAGVRRLGEVLHALHTPAPADAPRNPHRGVALAERPYAPLERLPQLLDGAPPRALTRTWERAVASPVPVQRSWTHGDLHARNLIVRDGTLSAVIDWGDLGGGDPAVDLSALWTVLDPVDHAVFCAAYGPVEGELLARSRGWALAFAVIFAGLQEDAGAMRLGRRMLERLQG